MIIKIVKYYLAVISLCFVNETLCAQQIMVIIDGATIHTGNGRVIENGFIGFGDGKIMLCDSVIVNSYKTARFIHANGKHIYPGFICMNTSTGLNEIDQARPTHDFNETGSLNPNVRSLIAYNTDSKVTPTLKSNGITMVQVVPEGGLISGTSSIMKTEGWNWEDAVYKTDDGIHMNWPEFISNWWNTEKSDELKLRMDREFHSIEELFEQAYQYSKITKPEVANVRFEAMRGLFNGSKNLYVHVNGARGIISSINFIKKYNRVKMVLVGANDSYKLKELIAENNIPVVLTNVHRLPQRASEDVDQPYKTPFELMNAGITVAIGHTGSWQPRSVMFEAGTAVAYGLSKEDALKCLTLNPAKIIGIENTCGTLDVGKDATFIVSSGDVLDMRSSNIEQMFISGQEINLDNRQKELYRKFSDKYQLK